jgi:hypothetical protein
VTFLNIVEPQRLPGIDVAPKQRLFIRDLIAPGQRHHRPFSGCSRPALPMRKSGPENTTKPYSNIEFTPKITPVTTIAHHVQGIQADPG